MTGSCAPKAHQCLWGPNASPSPKKSQCSTNCLKQLLLAMEERYQNTHSITSCHVCYLAGKE